MNQKEQNKQILVIGSSCVDIIINIHHLPRTEEDIHPTGQSMSLGGCAFNAASMIRRFGAPVTLLSPVGTGFYGEFAARELERRGFPVNVHVPDLDNGCCYCLVEHTGERTFMSCHGAEYTFQKSWMEQFPSDAFDMVYVCGLEIEEPTGLDLIEYLEAHPDRQIFYAPGPRGIHIEAEKTERLYGLHPILHINENEAMALSDASTVKEAAAALFRKTGNSVIITLGGRGAYCLESPSEEYYVPGIPAKVINTIGAGDSHIGAVMASRKMGCSMKEAIRCANLAAVAVVSSEHPSLTEEEFLQKVVPYI